MTDNMAEREGHYEFDLFIQLQTRIDQYEDDRDKYWGARVDLEDWSPLRQLREDASEIAKLLWERAYALKNVGDVSETNAIYRVYHEKMDAAREKYAREYVELGKFLRTQYPNDEVQKIIRILTGVPDPQAEEPDEPLRLVWESLCIRDARRVVESMTDRIDRMFDLERLIHEELGRHAPPEACVRFLANVSRCFVYEFSTECVVMCRSAMETAFREKITITDVHRKQFDQLRRKRDHETDGLADRILVVFNSHDSPLLRRKDLYKDAQAVKNRGDKAVHYDPDATKDLLGTIRSALRVINALSELPDAIP